MLGNRQSSFRWFKNQKINVEEINEATQGSHTIFCADMEIDIILINMFE